MEKRHPANTFPKYWPVKTDMSPDLKENSNMITLTKPNPWKL